jgi:hypothetical protein
VQWWGSNLYLGKVWFETHLHHQLSWLWIFTVFLSPLK